MHQAKGDRFVRASELPVCDNEFDWKSIKPQDKEIIIVAVVMDNQIWHKL